jgi:hypothetical protein
MLINGFNSAYGWNVSRTYGGYGASLVTRLELDLGKSCGCKKRGGGMGARHSATTAWRHQDILNDWTRVVAFVSLREVLDDIIRAF